MILPSRRSPERGIVSSVEGDARRAPATEDGMQAGKHPQAIATKVLPPRCVGLIERPRLLELVTQVEMKPLSVIKAGAANYGVGLALSGRPRMTEHSGALPMSARPPVRIDVLSDVVCPWCFIGKRRLERAIAMKPEIPVEVHWRPYFLNDWIPREGISREQYLTTKFGSPERYKGIAQRVAAAAAQEGLVYAIDKISNQPNTTDAHRLIRWAAGIGKAAEMEQRLMDLYFTEGATHEESRAGPGRGRCRARPGRRARGARQRQGCRGSHARSAIRQGGRHRRRALLHLRRASCRLGCAVAGISRRSD